MNSKLPNHPKSQSSSQDLLTKNDYSCATDRSQIVSLLDKFCTFFHAQKCVIQAATDIIKDNIQNILQTSFAHFFPLMHSRNLKLRDVVAHHFTFVYHRFLGYLQKLGLFSVCFVFNRGGNNTTAGLNQGRQVKCV